MTKFNERQVAQKRKGSGPCTRHISVRKATAADIAIVAEMTALLAVEAEEYVVDRRRVANAVARIVAKPDGKAQYWLAVDGDAVIGQLLVWRQPFPMKGGVSVWIDDVYVQETHRRRGVFSKLLGHVSEIAARDPEVIGQRLIVILKNAKTLLTYLKHDFEADGHILMRRKSIESAA